MIQFCLFHPFSWSESTLPKPKQPFSLKIFTFFHRNPSNTTLFDLQLLFSLHFNDRGIKWEIIHERGRDSKEDSQSEPFVGLIFYIHSVSLFDYEEINQKILGFRIGWMTKKNLTPLELGSKMSDIFCSEFEDKLQNQWMTIQMVNKSTKWMNYPSGLFLNKIL